MKLRVKRLDPDAALPSFSFMGDAGADLAVVEGALLDPGQAKDFSVGIAVEPPIGYFFIIHPRSSTLRKRGLFVHVGIIDNGYRGPLYVYVRNDTRHSVYVEKGARLAQMILLPFIQPVVEEVDELEQSDRGPAGFGSTGLSLNPLLRPSSGAQ